MSDTTIPTIQKTQTDDSAHPSLSDKAENLLATAVGHDLELSIGDQTAPLKTVKQVLGEMIHDQEELAITLEYGAGESGVDQASWEIEVTTLQRAFMRKQKHHEISDLSKQIAKEVAIVRSRVDETWIDKTTELRSLMKLFEQAQVSRQDVDDYQHRIFGRDAYVTYVDSVIAGTDQGKLLNAVGNLTQIAQQLNIDHSKLTNPSGANNSDLAEAIIQANGDIDALAHELERDMPSAVFRRNIAIADRISSILSEEFLKRYKLWAHSYDLNIREVLATEKSATNGRVSDKSRDQLKEMLRTGADQINQLLQVIK